MMRACVMLLTAFLLSIPARALTVWTATSQVTGVTGALLTTNIAEGPFRIRLFSFDGTNEADMSYATIRLLVADVRDDTVVTSATTRLAANIHSATGSLTAAQSPYRIQFVASGPDTNVAPTVIYWATVTATSAPSAGAASVTINDPTMFVTANGTSTPDSVSIQDQAGTVITGTLVGAHLYLHLPPGVQTVQGVAGAVTLGAGSGTSRVGEVYWDSTTLRYGTNQPYGEILTLDIPVVNNTAAVDIARGYSFRCAPTGAFKLAFSTPRSSTNTASWGVIDFIGIASTNWISFDYGTIESNSAAAVTLGTGAVWSLKYYAPAGQAVNKVGVYDLL